MKTLIAAAVTVLALTAGPRAAAPDLTGTWALAVDGPHGSGAMSLVLTQKGERVSGTFISGHGADLIVNGEFSGGTLKLESADDEHHKVLFNARLKDDGTLAGYVSGPMGDMKWTAARAKARK